MAKTFKGSGSITAALDDLVKQTGLRDPRKIETLARAYAEEAALLIYARTKRGYGVSSMGGAEERLAPLSPRYVERRSRSTLHSTTSARKSNLTFTGQMLDGITAVKRQGGGYTVVIKGSRRGGGSNARIALYVANANPARPFFALSAREQKKLGESYRRNFAFLANGGRGR